jgi:hypothetical protein
MTTVTEISEIQNVYERCKIEMEFIAMKLRDVMSTCSHFCVLKLPYLQLIRELRNGKCTPEKLVTVINEILLLIDTTFCELNTLNEVIPSIEEEIITNHKHDVLELHKCTKEVDQLPNAIEDLKKHLTEVKEEQQKVRINISHFVYVYIYAEHKRA